MPHRGAHDGLNLELYRFQSGGSPDPFLEVALPFLERLASRLGWSLAPDKRPEISQQAVLLLLTGRAGRFDPTRGSAETFLRYLTLRAKREVEAMYPNPGNPTRRRSRKKPTEQERVEQPAIPLDDLPEGEQPSSPPAEVIAANRIDAEKVLLRAEPRFRAALKMIYYDRVPVVDVADEVGISRFAISREVSRLVRAFAAA